MSDPVEARSKRILDMLSRRYPDKRCYDLDGRGLHFVCEIEPVDDHQEYDRAVEVIIKSTPHVHNKMTQTYTVRSGTLELHSGDQTIILKPGESYVVKPKNVHWAMSDNEAVVEIYSQPGWTKKDHIIAENWSEE